MTENTPTVDNLSLSNYDSVENQQLRSARLQVEMDNKFATPEISPTANAFLSQIRTLSEAGIYSPNIGTFGSTFGTSDLAQSFANQQDTRLSFSEFVTPATDVYERLNDGTYAPIYENILVGSNNEERLAREQGRGEVWRRGWRRFRNQVLTSGLGNLTGIPVGIAEWINTGNFEATYDNDYTRWLDDLDRKSQLRNNIYYTQADKDASLFGQMGTSRFWADKALGGAAFTVGMILSEGLLAYATGGLSLGRLPITAGQGIARFASKMGVKQTGKILGTGLTKSHQILGKIAAGEKVGLAAIQSGARGRILGQRIGQIANDVRFIATSSGYEAGMEARHFRKDAEEQFYDYYNRLGRQPTPEEVAEFRKELDNSSNLVFGANMGILGVSNVALFGRMFGVGNYFKGIMKPIDKEINKRIFGIGTKQVGKNTFEPIKRNTFQKVLSPTWHGIVKPVISEGFWEEGGQGVASTMMSEYIKSTYDPELTEGTLTYLEAFQKGLEETYGTKDGQTEVLIGAIIGVLFGSLSGTFTRGHREAKAQTGIAETETFVANAPDQIVKAFYTQENLLSQLGNANRAQHLEEGIERAEQNGELVEANLKTKALVVSALQAAESVGKPDSFLEVLKGTILGMEDSKIMEQFGLSAEQVQEFKQDKVNAVTRIAENHRKATRLADTYISDNSLRGEYKGKEQLIRDGITFAMVMSAEAEQTGLDSIRTIKEIYEGLQDPANVDRMDVLGMIALAPPKLKQEYDQTQQQIESIQEEIQRVIEELQEVQSQPAAERNLTKEQELQQKLQTLQSQASLQSSVLNGLRETIENKYFEKLGTEGITSLDSFTNLETALQEQKKAVQALEFTNPEEYLRLTTAFDALDKSLQLSSEFSEIYKGLLDPKFRTKAVAGIFGKALNRGSSMNQVTLDTLQKIAGIKEDTLVITTTPSTTSTFTSDPLNVTGETIAPTEEAEVLSEELQEEISQNEKERQEELNKEQSRLKDEAQKRQAEVTNKPVENLQDVSVEQQKADTKRRRQAELEKPYKTFNDGSNTPVTITVTTTEKDGIKKTKFETQTRNKKGEPRTQNDKGYNSFEEAVENLGIDLQSEENETAIELANTVKEVSGREVVPTRVLEIRENTDDSSPFYGRRVATISVGTEKIDFILKNDAELESLNNQTASEQQTQAEATQTVGGSTFTDYINTFFNRFYIEKVKTGELTVEQALQALEQAGQQNSFEYRQLQSEAVQAQQQVQETLTLQRLREIVGSIPLIQKYFPSLSDDFAQAEVTQEDLDTYKELQLKQQKGEELTKAELDTYENLRTKFLGFNVLQGTRYNGHTLLELISLYNQLENTVLQEEQNKTEFNEAEYVEIAIESENIPEAEGANTNPAITQIQEYAFGRFAEGGVYISHLQLSDLIQKALLKFPDAKVKINGEVVTENFEKFDAKGGTQVEIETPEGTFALNIQGKKGKRTGQPVQLKSKQASEDLNTLFGIQALSIKGQKGDWYVLYEGEVPLRGTFVDTNESGLVFDSVEARKVQAGDTVQLVYDPTDSYNKTLKGKGKVEQANIYIVKNGKIIGKLKATKDDTLYEIRRKVVAEGTAEITVASILPPIPLLQVNPDGSKKLVPVQKSEVIAHGWMQDEAHNVDIPEGTSMRYVEAASKLHPTKKIPFVVLKDKVTGYPVAFPVELTSDSNPLAVQEFEDIINNTDLSPVQKAQSLNELLIRSNIEFPTHSFNELNVEDSEHIQTIRQAVEESSEPIDLDRFTENLDYNIYTIIDTQQQDAFTPPKLLLDFESFSTEINPENVAQEEIPVEDEVTALHPDKPFFYSFYSENYYLTFENNIDESLIAVHRGVPNSQEHLEFLQEELGLEESEIRKLAKTTNDTLSSRLVRGKGVRQNVPTLYNQKPVGKKKAVKTPTPIEERIPLKVFYKGEELDGILFGSIIEVITRNGRKRFSAQSREITYKASGINVRPETKARATQAVSKKCKKKKP